MAGTLAFVDSNTRVVRKYVINWTSDAAGAADGDSEIALSGVIERINFVPSIIDVPTNGYTMTLVDEDGIDVLQGLGLAGLSDVTVYTAVPLIAGNKVVVDDVLTMTVAGAGNVKKGLVTIYLSRKV